MTDDFVIDCEGPDHTHNGCAQVTPLKYRALAIAFANMEGSMPVPRSNEVVVRQVGRVTKTESGLYLPDAERYTQRNGELSTVRDEFPPRGTVLAVGSKVVDVNPGDVVYFARETDAKKGTSCRAMIPDTRLGGPERWTNLLVMHLENVQLVIEVA